MGIIIEGNTEGKTVYVPYDSSVGVGDVIIRILVAAILVVAGLYAIYLATFSHQIAFNNGAGYHLIFLLSSFGWAGRVLIVCGILYACLPMGYRSISIFVSILTISGTIAIGEYKIHKYGYEVPNERVFAHRFMHIKPPIAIHDGRPVQDRLSKDLNELREIREKHIQQFLAK